MADRITIADKLNEIERELKTRRRVYTRLISRGKMSPFDASRFIAIMEAIRDDYRWMSRMVAGDEWKDWNGK